MSPLPPYEPFGWKDGKAGGVDLKTSNLQAAEEHMAEYARSLFGAADAMLFMGVIDCSGNPKYPAADRGATYKVSVAGKIGGGSGLSVEVGDLLICLTDGTAEGTQAGVGASWAVLQTNLDVDTDSTFAANSDGRVPSQKAVKAALDKVTLGTDWSAGDNILVFSSAVTPRKAEIRDGTSGAPVSTVGPTVKINRKEANTVAAIEAVGGAGSDGADVLGALQVISEGQEASEVQSVALYAAAKNKSSFGGGNPDASALYAIGIITGGTAPKATAIGATIIGRREAGVVADVSGIELNCHNRAAAGSYASAGASDTKALWINALGTADSGCGIQFGNVVGRKFKVGIGFNSQNGGGVADSTLRDDGEATQALDIRGKHTYALKVNSPESGAVVIGRSEIHSNNPNALLEVANDSAGRDPLVNVGSNTAAQNYSLMVRNSAGTAKLFAGGVADAGFTGAIGGDTAMIFTAGKTFRIGAAGKTHKISVTEKGLSFYGVAPVERAAAIGEPAETLASLKEKVNAIRNALKNIGITE